MITLHTKDYKHFQILGSAGEILHTFEEALNAGKALPGDSVELGATGCSLLKRADHPPLVGLLELNTKVLHGFNARGRPLRMFRPYNEAYPPMLVACDLHDVRVNHLIVAVFENWENAFPRAGLQKWLGVAGEKGVELQAAALQYSPFTWSAKHTATLQNPSFGGRMMIDAPTINIDPKGCRDIDDVVSLWSTQEGEYRIAIGIADVAAWMEKNPELSAMAERIGQTLYEEGVAVRPLLPAKLSEDLLSLVPQKQRLTLSLLAKWDGVTLVTEDFKETVTTNTASYTYENCYAAKEIPIPILKNIASHLLGHEENDSHKWIEALMLFYNTEAAKVLVQKNAGLLRAHSAPDMERFATMERIGLPAKEMAYPAAVYRSSGGEDVAHWGLDRAAYCHASSPIRRYADIVNQRVLKGLLTTDNYSSLERSLTALDKNGKAYERDRFFIEQICADKDTVPAIVVDEKKVYIIPWKRMVSFATEQKEAGEKISLTYYVNRAERSWKKRLVLRDADTDSLGQQCP
jgi:exoribonuclease R